jgi:MFS family permease
MDLKLLLLINLSYFSTYLVYSIFPPYLPKVAGDDKGVDQQTIGFIMCFWFIGYAVFAILMGHILLYTGRKNAILLGLIILAFDFILASLCTELNNKTLFVLSY